MISRRCQHRRMQKLMFHASLFLVVACSQPVWASHAYTCLGKFTVDAVRTFGEKQQAPGDKEVTIYKMALKISNLKFAKLNVRNDLGQSGCIAISKKVESGIEVLLLREDPKALTGNTFYLFHFCRGSFGSEPCEPYVISNKVFERWKKIKDSSLRYLVDKATWP